MAENNSGERITIHKIVVKGDKDKPQLVMVLGTTRVQGDLWVRLSDAKAKVKARAKIGGVPDFGTISELARFVGVGDPDHGPVRADVAQASNPSTSLYGVSCGEGEALWVARFYVDDHRRKDSAGGEQEDLALLWLSFAESSTGQAPGAIRVTAWCLDAPPDWRKAGAESNRERLAGPVTRTLSYDVVESGWLYDLGILFVHGIGPHKVRDTLIAFGEPIVRFWERWFSAVTARAAASYGRDERERFVERTFGGALRNVADLEGITRELDNFKRGAGAAEFEEVRQRRLRGVLCASVRAEDTLFKGDGSDQPSSTLIRQTLVGDDGKLRESHTLLSEAWWSAEAVYPSLAELTDWITVAFPAILRMHLGAMLRADWDECAGSMRESSWRRFPNLIILLTKVLVYAPLVIIGALLAQAGLFLLGMLSMVPIAWLKRGVRSLVDALMGTIGQSYALKMSKIRCNAIVRAVARDLDWMQERCDEVVVISHSQGAEVTRLVFEAAPRPRVSRWITLGSGIKPLSLLEQVGAGNETHGGFSDVFNLSTGLLLLSGFLNLLSSMYGQQILFGLPLGELVDLLYPGLWVLFFLMLYLLLESGLAGKRRAPVLRLRRSIMRHWDDYYASHDPVAAGSMFEAYREILKGNGSDGQTSDRDLPKEQEIANHRSVFFDHTSYLDNLEQFVAPVAMELFAKAGDASGDDKEAVCKRAFNASVGVALARASERRRNLTWWSMVLDYSAILLALAAVAWSAFGPEANWLAWASMVTASWNSADGMSAAVSAVWESGVVGLVFTNLWNAVLVGIAYLLASVLVRRGFERSRKSLYHALASAFDAAEKPLGR